MGPSDEHLNLLDELLSDARYDHVVLDISWDEVAKYVVADAQTAAAWAALIEEHPTRFLFGTDSVGASELGPLREDLRGLPAVVGTPQQRGAGTGRTSQLRAGVRRGNSPR